MSDTNLHAILATPKVCPCFQKGIPSVLDPLINRPIIQYVIERLASQGFSRIDLLIHDEAAEIESCLGDGSRWGVEISYQLVRDPNYAFSRLAQLVEPDSPALLFVVNEIPDADIAASIPSPSNTTAFVRDNGQRDTWSGIAWITHDFVGTLPKSIDRELFETQLLNHAKDRGELIDHSSSHSVSNYRDLLETQSEFLAGQCEDLFAWDKAAHEGVWIQRNVYIHPSVRFVPPVYIGSNSEISADVVLGPNAVIGQDCFVDSKCEISDSLVMRDTMLGEGLDVNNCIISRQQLFHASFDVALNVFDDVLIGSRTTTPTFASRWRRVVKRGIAGAILVATCPLLLLLMLLHRVRFGTYCISEEVVKLPAKHEITSTFARIRLRSELIPTKTNLGHCLTSVLPGLIHVFRGQIYWIGVTPLPRDAVDEMPSTWRDSYLHCHAGIINESTIMYGDHGSNDDNIVAEIYYANIRRNWRTSLRQVFSYACTVVFGPRAISPISLPGQTAKAIVS